MQSGVEWLFRGQHIRAFLTRGTKEGVIATFDHWKADKCGFDPARPAGWVAERGFSHLSIQTVGNDWYLNRDIGPAQMVMRREAAALGPIRMVGFSMGGFGALMFGAALGATEGLLISPALPRKFKNAGWLAESAAGPAYALIYDPTIPIDVWRAQVLTGLVPRTRLVALEGGGHPATGKIRQAGRFNAVRRVATGEVADVGWLSRIHARSSAALAA